MFSFRRIVLIASSLIGCSTPGISSRTSQERWPAQTDSYYDNAPVAPDSKMDYAKFTALVRAGKFNRIADAVARASALYPDHMKHRTAVFDSRSLQEASYTEPRIIVYGHDAGFVFAFNGGPHKRAGHVIEMMAYNYANSRFEFREMMFKGERPGARMEGGDIEVEYEDANIAISKPDPVKCMDCHGYVTMMPIWDAYPLWPGVYGSNDDILTGSFAKEIYAKHGGYEYLEKLIYPRSMGRIYDLKPGAVDGELAGYLGYVRGASKHPRYKNLPVVAYENAFKRYVAGESFESINITDANTPSRFEVIARPNLELLSGLQKLSERSLLKEITSRGLDKKWSEIDWRPLTLLTTPGFACDGCPRDMNIDFNAAFAKAVGVERAAALAKKQGPFQTFLFEALRAEILMQVDRLKRVEQSSGPIVHAAEFVGTSRLLISAAIPDTEKFYQRILRKPALSRLEKIAVTIETGDLIRTGALAYMLRSEGITLGDYSLSKERVLAFHDNDLPYVFNFLRMNVQ